MPKKKTRKKYPKLPSGFGTIRYLGEGRRNCYAVHPPSDGLTLNGSPNRPPALCYVDTWIKGFTVLTSYKAGNYVPGMEKALEVENTANLETLAQRILADYNTIKGVDEKSSVKEKTFKEVYEDFYKWKFEEDDSKSYSKSSIYAARCGFKHASALHDKVFRDLKYNDLQSVVDSCDKKHATLELIVSLFKQMYAYADIYELCDKDYSAHLKIKKPDDDEGGVAFTGQELEKLWKNQDNEIIEMVLIMCYSGYRIKAYKTLEINFKEQFFKGGVKTAAGKDRIVPIHSAINSLVKRRFQRYGSLLPVSAGQFRLEMYKALDTIGIVKHTPHDCRHTFSMLCEKYQVNENDRKRMMGHSFGNDITNAKYGHRSVEELRKEIEKIKPPFVTNL